MQTQFFTQETITQAAHLLREGKLVAFPTETVYGLGADATNSQAIASLFEAKDRPQDNPLIVHIASISQLKNVTRDWSEAKQILAENFWPGPLTIISSRHPDLSPLVSPHLETVGIRIPAHPLALELLALVRRPIAAPSANLSGRPSPTTAEMVAHDLMGKISGILTCTEPLTYGLESTVVSLDEEKKEIHILREGFITQEDLEDTLVDFTVHTGDRERERASPGTRYAHYQPSCPVYLWDSKTPFLESASPSTGILIWEGWEATQKTLEEKGWKLKEKQGQEYTFAKGESLFTFWVFKDLGDYARGYYKTLFTLEQKGVKLIVAQECEKKWVGKALMNRLERSSAGARISLLSDSNTE